MLSRLREVRLKARARREESMPLLHVRVVDLCRARR
jgi:hypothetical protein